MLAHRPMADEMQGERALVEAWRAGDTDAMGLLYEKYAPALRAYCGHRLGYRGDVDDAVHDTFLRAQLGVSHFEPGARIWPWLATIAAHVCTDTLRRQARRLETDVVPVVAGDIEEHVAARARAAIVGDALQSLPPRYRVPIYLRHFVGSTYDEIARLQGRSVASVRSVLMRGRRHLGHRIEEVARSERQWPLPTTLPVIERVRSRLRVRPHRRVGTSTQQMLALQAGWLASSVLGMQAAAAVVGAVAPAVAATVTVAALGRPSANAGPGVRADAALSAHAWLPDAEVTTTVSADSIKPDFYYGLTGLDTSKPLPGGGTASVTLGYRIERKGTQLNMRHDIVATVPAAGRLSLSGGTRMHCYDRPADDPKRAACQAIAETAETAPQFNTDVSPL